MIIANASSAPAPTLAPRQRQRRKRYKRSLNRQCYPLHFMRECIPPNLHDPQRAKGSLDRRSKRLSFPHFFLRRKKCGRRRLAPAGATPAHSRAKEVLKRSFKWFSLVPFFLQKKKGTRAGARNAPSPARRREIIPVGDKSCTRRQGARNSPFRHTKNSPPATAEGLFFTDDIPACTPHSTARRNWTSWPGHCSDTHGCRRSRTPAR